MEEKENNKTLILVCGVDGSGKGTFCSSFKNSFLQSLPMKPIYEGLLSGISFASTSTLIDEQDVAHIKLAHEQGFKINVYYIFSGKLLSMARSRFRMLVEAHYFDENAFKKTYEQSYKGLISIYNYVDLVFFIRNQKEYEFLVAYDPLSTNEEDFKNAVKKTKAFVDHIK